MQQNKTPLIASTIILWIFFSLFPWQGWLTNVDVFRFLLGVIIYITPGLLTYLYFADDKTISLRAILIGFVFSIFTTGLLGVITRIAQLNITFIHWMFALWGALIIFILFYKNIPIKIHIEKINHWQTLLLLIPIVAVFYFASITNPPLIHDDAFTYNAFLFYFQNAPVWDFNFPDALNRFTIARFWIAYWPLVEAMISDLSGVDGLLITGTFLPPLLAVFSFMGIYSLAVTLGLPRLIAGTAVLAQGFSLMRLSEANQPGFLFFQRLTEDKVTAAFVISLALIILSVEYFEKPTLRNFLMAWAVAWAMVFTHPVQFGMTCMVIGVYGLYLLINKHTRLKYILYISALAMIVMIPYLFRFIGGAYADTLSFSMQDVQENNEEVRLSEGRVDVIEGTNYYGISTQQTVGLPYEISFIAVLVSLFYFWKNKTARYVLSAFFILGFAVFPYTGWIIGTFTTPFQLWRLTWQTPFGIAIAFFIWFGFEIVQKIKLPEKFKKWLSPVYHGSVYVILIALLLLINRWALSNVEKGTLDTTEFYINYSSTANLMNNLEVNNTPIILGGPDTTTNSIIPSLTIKFQPLMFRVNSGDALSDRFNSMVGDDIPADIRWQNLKEYNVSYLLLKGQPEWVLDLVEKYPENITFLFRDGRFSLYQLIH